MRTNPLYSRALALVLCDRAESRYAWTCNVCFDTKIAFTSYLYTPTVLNSYLHAVKATYVPKDNPTVCLFIFAARKCYHWALRWHSSTCRESLFISSSSKVAGNDGLSTQAMTPDGASACMFNKISTFRSARQKFLWAALAPLW